MRVSGTTKPFSYSYTSRCQHTHALEAYSCYGCWGLHPELPTPCVHMHMMNHQAKKPNTAKTAAVFQKLPVTAMLSGTGESQL